MKEPQELLLNLRIHGLLKGITGKRFLTYIPRTCHHITIISTLSSFIHGILDKDPGRWALPISALSIRSNIAKRTFHPDAGFLP